MLSVEGNTSSDSVGTYANFPRFAVYEIWLQSSADFSGIVTYLAMYITGTQVNYSINSCLPLVRLLLVKRYYQIG